MTPGKAIKVAEAKLDIIRPVDPELAKAIEVLIRAVKMG